MHFRHACHMPAARTQQCSTEWRNNVGIALFLHKERQREAEREAEREKEREREAEEEGEKRREGEINILCFCSKLVGFLCV